MNEKIKLTFDNIHAEQELKTSTLNFIESKRSAKKTSFRTWMPLAASLVLLLVVGFFGVKLYNTPVAVISVDINPSIEISINRFDRVIDVTGYNDDGNEFAQKLQIKNLKYSEAIDAVMNSDLPVDSVISLTVAGKDERKREHVFSDMKEISDKKENMLCDFATEEEVLQAHEKGLSFGKYKAYLKLTSNGDNVTIEEIKDMPMKDIKTRFDSFEKGNHGKDNNDNHGNNYDENDGKHHGKDENTENDANRPQGGNGFGKGENEDNVDYSQGGNGFGKGENEDNVDCSQGGNGFGKGENEDNVDCSQGGNGFGKDENEDNVDCSQGGNGFGKGENEDNVDCSQGGNGFGKGENEDNVDCSQGGNGFGCEY